MPTKKTGLAFEVPLSKAASKLAYPSVHLELHTNEETKIPPHYVQKATREIQFLWTYCPFASEEEFSSLVLNYMFSESRIAGLHDYPFTKVVLTTPNKVIPIERYHFNIETEKTKFGSVDSLLVTPVFGVYRLRIASGFKIPPHLHHIMEEQEIVLTDGLSLDGKSIPAGTVNVWPHRKPHSYENTSSIEQCILCIDKPPFDANDEVLV